MANEKVRQALNHAVDKQRLIGLLDGAAVPLDGQVVNREANGWTDKITTTYPYDLSLARRLMAEAGFPEGFKLPIYYTESADNRERRELTAIAEDLSKINVQVALQGHDPTTHLRRRRNGTLTPAFYESFAYYPSEDASVVMDYFRLEKTESFTPTYDYEDFEIIYKLSTSTEQPDSIRTNALQVSMRFLSERPPAIFLYQPLHSYALRPAVRGLVAYPDFRLNFDRLGR